MPSKTRLLQKYWAKTFLQNMFCIIQIVEHKSRILHSLSYDIWVYILGYFLNSNLILTMNSQGTGRNIHYKYKRFFIIKKIIWIFSKQQKSKSRARGIKENASEEEIKWCQTYASIWFNGLIKLGNCSLGCGGSFWQAEEPGQTTWRYGDVPWRSDDHRGNLGEN